MKIFCCYTPAHFVLFDQYFRPSLPPHFDLQATEFLLEGPGDFLSAEFLTCVRRKVERIMASILENPGQWIIWSDVDIVFVRDPHSELERLARQPDIDIFFQREGHGTRDVNTGFIFIHCTDRALAFFRAVQERLSVEPSRNEQLVINELLSQGQLEGAWDYLPFTFYARTHGWPPPKDAMIYHANFTPGNDGIGQKIRQFTEFAWIRRWGFPAWLYSCMKRVPGKLFRVAFGG